MPRQFLRIFYYFLLFQIYKLNLQELLDRQQNLLEGLKLQHLIPGFVLHAILAIHHMLRISIVVIAQKEKTRSQVKVRYSSN